MPKFKDVGLKTPKQVWRSLLYDYRAVPAAVLWVLFMPLHLLAYTWRAFIRNPDSI